MSDRPDRLNDLTRTVRTKVHACGCGCWVWTGSTDRYGYAGFKLRGKRVLVHRYTYQSLVGDIPTGFDIDHLCDRHRSCVNPAHMEPVAPSENSRRANQRRFHGEPPDRSHCTVQYDGTTITNEGE